ncbi:hypothetical protein [Priestia koreensis]|uniref:hypothetical protein n=1 Tax=Priestia koreensis TaxID=284581 RepID=UPI003457CBDF
MSNLNDDMHKLAERILGNVEAQGKTIRDLIKRVEKQAEILDEYADKNKDAAVPKMTANEVLKAIENMENGERIKLLAELSKNHFGGNESLEDIKDLHNKFWDDEN